MARVTDVRIRREYGPESKLKAVLSATLDNAFVVHGIKVLQGEEGEYIAMPAKKLGEGVFKDVFHPISNEARDSFQKQVLSLYQEALSGDTSLKEEG